MYKVDMKRSDCREIIRSALEAVGNTFDDNDILLLKKGAPDILLPHCSTALFSEGIIVSLDDQTKARIMHVQES